MKLSEMDIVYIYKSNGSEELKYSLRSLKNIPHRNVIISGDGEDWFSDEIIHLPRDSRRYYRARTKYSDAENNLLRALNYEGLSDNFILFNDDFFVMSAIKKVPHYNIGTLKDCLAERLERTGETGYTRAIRQTAGSLAELQLKDPLNFSVHTPMVMSKSKRLAVSKLINGNVTSTTTLARTVYGNLFIDKSEQIEDVKVYDLDTVIDNKFVSTDERSFEYGEIGKVIREKFCEPSMYEVAL